MPKTPRFPPTMSRAVEMLIYPAVQMLDVTGPLQVFASANEIVARDGGKPPYVLRVVAKDAGRLTVASSGLGLFAEPLPDRVAGLDTLLVAGGAGVAAAAEDATLVAWVGDRARQARRVASVCTGALLLATAGVLDGRRAATHWSFCAELARRFPQVRVEGDPIFVRDGPVWSSAGVTAGIDLALALVEEDLGRATALAVARYLVVFLKRPGGQAQFSTALSLQEADDRFGALHRWINAHLAKPLPLSALAEAAGMSERSFSRHYVNATGLTPARAVEKLRVEAARRLLSDSRLPMKRIAQRCGFGSEETMRRSFVRLLAVAPQEYRARFNF
ncbi:MAG TPA: GlxA family transcriptional regulator [Acetobacteraceae bacterium]